MAELVSQRYAEALFEAGLELGNLDKIRENFGFVVDAINSEEDIMKLLTHPKVSSSEKKELVKNIFGAYVEQEVLNFLYVLIDKRREGELNSIYSIFKDLHNDHKGIMEITAITAVELDEERKEKLKDALNKKFAKDILLNNVIDKSIVGGVVLKTKDKYIDGSIKGQLNEMERLIKDVSL